MGKDTAMCPWLVYICSALELPDIINASVCMKSKKSKEIHSDHKLTMKTADLRLQSKWL